MIVNVMYYSNVPDQEQLINCSDSSLPVSSNVSFSGGGRIEKFIFDQQNLAAKTAAGQNKNIISSCLQTVPMLCPFVVIRL
jgi:hypothetical protein